MVRSDTQRPSRFVAFSKWVACGSPWVWINAGAVTISLLMVVGLVGLVVARGVGYFWPAPIALVTLNQQYLEDGKPQFWAGQLWDEDIVPRSRLQGVQAPEDQDVVRRFLFKTGNRDLDGFDFRWFNDFEIESLEMRPEFLKVERREWGYFFGVPVHILESGQPLNIDSHEGLIEAFAQRLERALNLYTQIVDIERNKIGSINFQLEKSRLQERRLELDNTLTEELSATFAKERERLGDEYRKLESLRAALFSSLSRDSIVMATADGREKTLPLSQVVSFSAPNTLGYFDRILLFLDNARRFVAEEPREANTEGGVFPAIFGTVVMVFLMTLIVTPFGVIAAVYLREYAKQGILTRTVRIAVNNLAGVPSIVYGVFGLGFFVYFLGGSIDELFYPEVAPAPMFGTPGLLWASLTLALLTVPVVIVATEEGLSRIPRSLREGSYALGATKLETMFKVVIPMASPAIMTGMILAIARAAGEVAPLMLVGVVKLAPNLPLDANAPYLHLDRKFMHLGFHIYDVGFQSPNVEAARPLVYATASLLVGIIGFLNLSAIYIRNSLREKFKSLEF